MPRDLFAAERAAEQANKVVPQLPNAPLAAAPDLFASERAAEKALPIPQTPQETVDAAQRRYGTLTAPTLSPSQWLASQGQDILMAGGYGLKPYDAEHFATGLTNIGKTLIPPMGAILSGADAIYNARGGRYGQAALEGAGALIPAGLGAYRLAKGVPQIPTADLPQLKWNPETGKYDNELLNVSRGQYNAHENLPLEFHPQAVEDIANRTKYAFQNARDLRFTPESAPGVYDTLDRWTGLMRDRGTPITPYDINTMRGDLRAFPADTTEGVAGKRASDVIDAYLSNPPPGSVRLTQGAQPLLSSNPNLLNDTLDTLRSNLADARGNWRAGQVGQTVEQAIDRSGSKAQVTGGDAANNTSTAFGRFANTDAGANQISGALPSERLAIKTVAEGAPLPNFLDKWGSRLTSGRASQMGSAAGYGLGWATGADPATTLSMAGAGAAGPAMVGSAVKGLAGQTTLDAAQETVNQILRNSPLYQAREALSPPVTDPRSMMRDAIAYAMTPQAAQSLPAVINPPDPNQLPPPYIDPGQYP